MVKSASGTGYSGYSDILFFGIAARNGSNKVRLKDIKGTQQNVQSKIEIKFFGTQLTALSFQLRSEATRESDSETALSARGWDS